MKNLFVGNMSFQTTADDLRALFEPFGQLARVHVATDRETGRARGFGFDFHLDPLGRVVIDSPEILDAINGAMMSQGAEAMLINGGCSNSGCK